ncbi:glycosyltransferase family 4 protein [Chitinophaga japonensis]|uniref:Glycosyl transferase family 1 n=1 Tax=Chitinophaga japonensis TaxID=104662 RepID=A0A562T2B8_CHIJA|nr:glycosyltransferase family 4 protein [Chitinophaga japonensis]TWI86976.1 glycosyl transferase family 1 [Chitinophaga japonensis]
MQPRLKILTWHVHGSYLYYLSQGNYDIYLPTDEARTEGYIGRGATFPFGDHVREIPVRDIPHTQFDCILFQHARHYQTDQYEILSPAQRQLPRIYLEHDPPRQHPTDTRHIVDDPDMLLVHVTHFNKLMWDNNRTPAVVIEHGVMVPEQVRYTGQLERGIVVVNNLAKRGRRLGCDIFQEAATRVPLDLVGMNADELGGLGEIAPTELPEFSSQYRFFFHPIRYTSLGLAVCEAMMLGIPVVGLATTELATIIRNGHSGFIDTDPDALVAKMQLLLENPVLAARIGAEGRRIAQRRFNIARFTREWEQVFRTAVSTPSSSSKKHTNATV